MFYIGAVDGGVWKTDDYGRTWKPIFDDQPSGSIGASRSRRRIPTSSPMIFTNALERGAGSVRSPLKGLLRPAGGLVVSDGGRSVSWERRIGLRGTSVLPGSGIG